MAIGIIGIQMLICTVYILFAHAQNPAHPVLTESTATVYKGTTATLPCRFDGPVYAVYWNKGPTLSESESLVYIDVYYKDGKRGGTGYEQGAFNMTDDYSLIINNVSFEDEGRYICQVSDFTSGLLFFNHTDVEVIAIASELKVAQCQGDGGSLTLTNPEVCVYDVWKQDSNVITLDCTVSGFKPDVSLFWNSSEWVEESLSKTVLPDGTFERTASINLTISNEKTHGMFTCKAEGTSVLGHTASKTVIVPWRTRISIPTCLSPTSPEKDKQEVVFLTGGSCAGWKAAFSFTFLAGLCIVCCIVLLRLRIPENFPKLPTKRLDKNKSELN